MDNLNSSRNNKLILYSIVAGAAASIAGGIVHDQGWSNAIDIGGGFWEQVLDWQPLIQKGKGRVYSPEKPFERYLERKIRVSEFSPLSGICTQRKKFSNREEHSIIGNMKLRWLHYQFDDNKETADKSVIFSDGGFTEQTIFITALPCSIRCSRPHVPLIKISIICCWIWIN